MKTNILTLAITLTVGIILVGSLMMPVLEDSKEKDTIELASGTYTYHATTKMEGQIYSLNDSGYLLYDGESIGNSAIHIASDKFRVMYYNGTLTLYDASLTSNIGIKSLTINTDGTYEAVKSDDNTTLTFDDALEWFAGPTSKTDSDYVVALMPYFTGKLNETAEIYGASYASLTYGTDTLANSKNLMTFKGSINDLKANGYIRSTSENKWISAESTAKISATNEGDGVYAGSGMVAELTAGDYSNDATTAIALYTPATYKVTADSTMNSLLGVLPILVIVALVLAATSAIIIRRD